jgi:predicted permease
MSQSSPPPGAARKPAGGGVLVALVPWVLFTLVAQHGTLKLAAIAAACAAAGVCAYSARNGGRPKLIELAALATFAAFIVVSFLAGPAVTQWLIRYARAIASGVLALLVFASLAVVPFTAQYARQSTPREIWPTPRFKEINRRLTVMWGEIFTAMTASHVVAGAIDSHRANLIFNWAIPIALVIWGAKRSNPAEHDAAPARQRA